MFINVISVMIVKILFLITLLTLRLSSQPLPTQVAAEKFLGTLDASQVEKCQLPITSEDRENFRYTPQLPPKGERKGMPVEEMTELQRAAAMNLLKAALNEKTLLKVQQIMGLEDILAELEKDPIRRDSGKYFITIFGKPSSTENWGWRFEGHHCSLNLTFVPGRGISVTPSFLGASPSEVKKGRNMGQRVLAAEEDLARALLATLLSDGKTEVIFSKAAPNEIISAENRTVTALDPVGIAASEMTATQSKALMTLISEYTGRYRHDIATSDLEKMKKAGLGKIRFGWAGGTLKGEPYYYRIQGPTFLMEGANTQNQATHMHATWRDFSGDFGRDLLREHLLEEH